MDSSRGSSFLSLLCSYSPLPILITHRSNLFLFFSMVYYILVSFFFFFSFFGCPTAYGVSRAGVRSKPQLWQHWICNPLCWGGDRRSNLRPSTAEIPLIPLHHSGAFLVFIFNVLIHLEFIRMYHVIP